MNLKVLISQIWNGPSRFGDRMGWDWLTYNPGVFLEFALVARRNAPLFARALVDTFPHAKTICDVGSGTGQFVKALAELGRQVDGFEYSKIARAFAKVIGVSSGKFDLSNHPPLVSSVPYDLVYSLEVGEHIPAELSERFVETLVGMAPIVVVTCAQPGQQGHGHINCQKREFWCGLFAAKSYTFSHEYSHLLVESLSRYPRLSPFIISNLMIFTRNEL